MSFLQQTTKSYAADDQSWLASRHGTGEPQSVTLDTSTFTKATHYPDGFFKSGTPLKYNGTSKMYELWTTGTTLAGILFDSVPAPADNLIDVNAAMLDHCKVIGSRLPFAVDATGQGTAAGRIVFVN